jgi:hypothetical protein
MEKIKYYCQAREGDVLELEFTNRDVDGVAHNIDFHAVCGPGGGAPLLLAEKDETKRASFRLLHPVLSQKFSFLPKIKRMNS